MIEPSQPPQPANGTSWTPAQTHEPQIFEKFDGIDTQTSRPGVADEKMWWCDGFMPIGPRFLRTMWDVGTPIHFDDDAPIAFFEFANIGATPYAIVIHNDGSIHAVNTTTGVGTEIAVAGTILAPTRSSVGVCQFGSQYVIVVAQQTNGYFIWDGTTFYEPGDPAPGGGTMPTAVGGSAVETYQGRVWIADDESIIFSAPGEIADFSTGNGGGSFSSTDSFLRVRFTQLKQTNGFLYLIGDSSVNYISGVQTSGSPPVTTFTNQNADPEVGTPWGSAVTVFNRNILIANSFGVHVSYGAAVTKISDALDGIYNTVLDFGSFVPSAAKAIVFGKRIFLLLLPIVDPYTGQTVNKLLAWDGKRWWATSQSVSLIYIQYQEINSVLTAWGTDGSAIYPLFQNPSDAFTKVVQSKLWDKPGMIPYIKAASRLWGMCRYYSDESPGLRVFVDNETGAEQTDFDLGPLDLEWVNNADVEIAWTNNSGDPIAWTSAQEGIIVIDPTAVAQNGALLGVTVETEAADMALIQMILRSELIDYRG